MNSTSDYGFVRWTCVCLASIAATFSLCVAWADDVPAEPVRTFNIAAQPLSKALLEFSKQSGLIVTVPPALVDGKVAPEIHGSLSSSQVLEKLLSGTGLKASRTTSGGITIGKATTPTAAAPSDSRHYDTAAGDLTSNGPIQASAVESGLDKDLTQKAGLEEIIVTGTSIRGVEPAGSPLKIYSRDDISQSGAGSIDEFARQMTENFSGADTVANVGSSAVYGRFSGAGSTDNQFGSATFDIHGLGTTSTLTLLDGHRLPAAGANGLLTDISQIPLSAIDHIEVLTDGASAIYGADAVAGVVNVITRKNFDGAESSLRYGTTTSGGDGQFTGSQILGRSWASGGALVTYEYSNQEGLDASRRDFIPDQGGPYTLVPKNRRNSIFLSADQNLSEGTNASIEALYSDRDFQQSFTTISPPLEYYDNNSNRGHATQADIAFNIDSNIAGDWHAILSGNYGSINQRQDGTTLSISGTTPFNQTNVIAATTHVWETNALATGSLVSLPAGAIKASVGAELRSEQLEQINDQTSSGETSSFGTPPQQRHVASAFGELFVPIIGSANATAWAKRIEISAAARMDHYSDFGSTVNPKIGALWKPADFASLRVSYGSSFRAPSLTEKGGTIYSYTTPLADPTSPGGVNDTLIVEGGNPLLSPEKAKSWTAGFDVTPASVSGLKLSATYFDVIFKQRISSPLLLAGVPALNDPSLAPFITRNPNLALVEGYFNSPGFLGDYAGQAVGVPLCPTCVQTIFNDQDANIASTKESGVDFSVSYRIPTFIGDLSTSITGTRLIREDYQIVPNTPAFELLNGFAEPTKWKMRGNVGWSKGGFKSLVTINYVNAYDNTQFTPAQKIASWTTADAYVSYQTGEGTRFLASNLTVALSVQNLANRIPPYAAPFPGNFFPGTNPPPYDSANASPIGRLIAVSLLKRWGGR
jgi:iron complex outermembrane receptor protein